MVRFRSGNFNVKDELHFGRPLTDKSDEIFEKNKQDRHINSHHIVNELSVHR